MATDTKTSWKPSKPAKMPSKGSAWKQGVNRPKTNWASKTAVNRRVTGRAKQNKVG